MTWRDPPFAELLDTGHDPHALARDWITLWQSEMAAVSVDREAQETWQTLVGVWADAASAMLRAFGPPPDDERERARPTAAPRAAPADAASDTGDADADGLARRVAALERRLAELERGPG